MSQISCPVCGRDDLVQKVSAIYQNETNLSNTYSSTFDSSYGTNSGSNNSSSNYASNYNNSFTTTSHIQQSALAQRLTPPFPPTKPEEPSGCMTYTSFLAILIITCVIGLVVVTITDSILLGTIAFIGVTWYWIKALTPRRRRASEQEAATYQAQLQQYEAEWQAYQNRLNRWYQSYYCRRDGVMYVPGEGRAIPV